MKAKSMASNAKGNKVDRRAELIRAAREVLSEKGYEATTISEIVTRAGVAQGTFYWYFPSKSSVVTTLAQDMQKQIENELRKVFMEGGPLDKKIERSIIEAFRIIGKFRDVLAIVANAHLGETVSSHHRVFNPYYRLIAQLVRSEQDTGNIDRSITPDIVATLIVGTVFYAAYECYVYSSPIPIDMVITETARFVRNALSVRS
jgi:AcrR family transcriptional regulator